MASIIVKQIGGKEYAYLAFREGKKVVHRYLGPKGSTVVKEMVSEKMKTERVPERLYPFFWDTDPERLDMKRDSRYIIERLMELGDLDCLNRLQMVYPASVLIETIRLSRRISERSRNFWNIWFGVRRA